MNTISSNKEVSNAFTYASTYDIFSGEQPTRKHLSVLAEECGHRGRLLRKWIDVLGPLEHLMASPEKELLEETRKLFAEYDD